MVTPITAFTSSVVFELDLFFLDPERERFRDLDLRDRDLRLDRDLLRLEERDLLLLRDLERDLCLLERDLERDRLLPKLEASLDTVLSMFMSPESAAAVIRDCASFTFFMASSISRAAASCIFVFGLSIADVEWATLRDRPWNMTPL